MINTERERERTAVIMDIQGEWLIGGERPAQPDPTSPDPTSERECVYDGLTALEWKQMILTATGGTEIRRLLLCAQLAEQDGFQQFTALFDLDGNLIEDASYIKIKTGPKAGWWTWRIGTGPTAQWFHPSGARSGVHRRDADQSRGYRVGLVRRESQVRLGERNGRTYAFIAETIGGRIEIIDDGSLGTQYQDRDPM
jgi:hypothetical protein